jgi:hypothetical protein
VRNTILLFSILALAGCSTTDDTPTDASTNKDGSIDICDLDAFSGNGNACPAVSSRLCFPLCDAGGCRCSQGASGPVWKCVNDFSCFADGSPLADGGDDDASADASSADGGTD